VRRSITSILARGNLTVACSPEDPDQILGWVAWEDGGTVHYVYVKDPWRQDGLGRELVEHVIGAAPWRYTHRTQAGERLLDRLPPGTWDPYPARKDA
jgi:GNAT superfamily N-acetyltransferase